VSEANSRRRRPPGSGERSRAGARDERLSRGEFLSLDSTEASIRHLYEDIEENFDDYADFFKEIGLQLESGNGYFYFSRIGEGKQSIEQKLESFSKWLDYLDFLKTYNQSFTAGYQFRKSNLIEQISLDIELKEKAGHLYKKYGVGSYLEIVNKLLQEMQSMGFAECVSEQDETYKITSAFHYAEELVNMIQIANEDEIPE
jgi:hypothetical protein